MRTYVLLGLAASLTGCAADPATVGSSSVAILGGTPDGADHPAVCGIRITPPPPEGDEEVEEPFFCTGTLVGSRVVLTAAKCVDANLEDLAGLEVKFGPGFSNQGAIAATVEDVELHRYFNPDGAGVNDLALLLLTEAPAGISPVAINTEPLGEDVVGTDVTVVGFGETVADAGDEGLRRSATLQINAVAERHLTAGSSTLTTCAGDSGGPVFRAAGAGEELVAVTAAQSRCTQQVNRLRVDAYAAEFIHAYVDRFDGACAADEMATCTTVGCRTPDPDCDPCSWNGVCAEECPTRDWDCPLGQTVGEACAQSGECEELGTCVAAADDESFTYCTRPCEEGAQGECPEDMACDGGSCVFDTPSRGSQGYACSSATQCRSGICEDRICVFECDPDGDACAEPYVCGPSGEMPGVDVCLGEDLSGGGGFCAASGARSPGWLALAMLGGFLALRRRR